GDGEAGHVQVLRLGRALDLEVGLRHPCSRLYRAHTHGGEAAGPFARQALSFLVALKPPGFAGGISFQPMDLTEPVLLTPEGLERLKAELEVQRARRVDAADRLKEAFQPGDIEDNPEYEQAKEEVGLLDGRIYELEEMIGR